MNIEENEWFDELDDSPEEDSSEKSMKVRSQMETLDRKKINRDVTGKSPHVRQRPQGLVESMMKCVITDSTLEHSVRNYQLALTPRTERRYQSPLLSGRRVLSQIPRAAVNASPLHSPRRGRGDHGRVRVYASPARPTQERQEGPYPKLVLGKEKISRQDVTPRNICEVEQPSNLPTSPVVAKRLLDNKHTQPSDKEVIVKKGLLWVQQDKLFSRWKERFIVLTSRYLQFFKKTTSRISEMGAFIMKIRLSDLSSVNLEDRRGYLTLVISSLKEGRLVVRKTEGIRDWHERLTGFLNGTKDDTERKMESTEQFWDRTVKEDGKNRTKIGNTYSYLTPPRSSALQKKSPSQTYAPLPLFIPSSPIPSKHTEDDSGMESLKTNTSDSGSSLHAQSSARLSEDDILDDQNNGAMQDVHLYKKFDQVKSEQEKPRKDKHERGVSMTEYSKFRAKLPFITP